MSISPLTSLTRLMTVLVVVAGGVAGLAAPAQAVTILNCPFAVTATLNPGLGVLASGQTLGGTVTFGTEVSPLTPCTSTGVPFAGGTGTITGHANAACLVNPLGATSGFATGTVHVTWYDSGHHVSGHSTISFSTSVSGLIPVVDAGISAGDMDGALIVAQPVPTGFSGTCVLTPIVSLSFAGAVQFAA